LLQRVFSDEADVRGARNGATGLGFKFMASQMQIDFLLAEFEGLSAVKGNGFHAERVLVKVNGRVKVRNRQYEMIQVVDNESHKDLRLNVPRRWWANFFRC
jgi:hypothetical protein